MLASAGGKGPAVWAVISCKATSVWCNVCHATGGARRSCCTRSSQSVELLGWESHASIGWARVVLLRGALIEPAARCCGFICWCLGGCCSGLWCVECFWRAWLGLWWGGVSGADPPSLPPLQIEGERSGAMLGAMWLRWHMLHELVGWGACCVAAKTNPLWFPALVSLVKDTGPLHVRFWCSRQAESVSAWAGSMRMSRRQQSGNKLLGAGGAGAGSSLFCLLGSGWSGPSKSSYSHCRE